MSPIRWNPITSASLLSRNVSLAAVARGSPGRPFHFIGLTLISSMYPHHAALKVSTFLNGKRLMMDVANDMRLRFKDYLSTLNGSFYSSVHNHPVGDYGSGDLCFVRDKKGSAVQLTLDLPVDLH
jgi:hypothetical protein